VSSRSTCPPSSPLDRQVCASRLTTSPVAQQHSTTEPPAGQRRSLGVFEPRHKEVATTAAGVVVGKATTQNRRARPNTANAILQGHAGRGRGEVYGPRRRPAWQEEGSAPGPTTRTSPRDVGRGRAVANHHISRTRSTPRVATAPAQHAPRPRSAWRSWATLCAYASALSRRNGRVAVYTCR
jgi:hypothetical protein